MLYNMFHLFFNKELQYGEPVRELNFTLYIDSVTKDVLSWCFYVDFIKFLAAENGNSLHFRLKFAEILSVKTLLLVL
jgi:hypothetical protein